MAARTRRGRRRAVPGRTRRARRCRRPRRTGRARARRAAADVARPSRRASARPCPAFDRKSSATSTRTASGAECDVVVADAGRSRCPPRRGAGPRSPAAPKPMVPGSERTNAPGSTARIRAVMLGGQCFVTLRDQEQGAEVRIVLCCERCQGLVEPVARLVHDHDGHDRRNELRVRLHDGARLLPESPDLAALTRLPLRGCCTCHSSDSGQFIIERLQ